jgi:hypothetical protein
MEPMQNVSAFQIFPPIDIIGTVSKIMDQTWSDGCMDGKGRLRE